MKIKKGGSSFATWTKKLQGSWPSKSKTKTGKGKLFLSKSRRVANAESKEAEAEKVAHKTDAHDKHLVREEKDVSPVSRHQDQRDDVSVTESIEKRLDSIEQRFQENFVSVPPCPSSLMEERSQILDVQDEEDEGSRINLAADFLESGSETAEKSSFVATVDSGPTAIAAVRESSFVGYFKSLVNEDIEEDIYQEPVPNFIQESEAATSHGPQPGDTQLGVLDGAEAARESSDEQSHSQRVETDEQQETREVDLDMADHEQSQVAVASPRGNEFGASQSCDDEEESKSDKSLDESSKQYDFQPETQMPSTSMARNSIVESFSVDAESQCSSKASSSAGSEESGEANDVDISAATNKDYIPVGSMGSEQEMPQNQEIDSPELHTSSKLPSSNVKNDDDSVSIQLPPCIRKAFNSRSSSMKAEDNSVSIKLPSSNSKISDDKLPSSNSKADDDKASVKLPSSNSKADDDKARSSSSAADQNLSGSSSAISTVKEEPGVLDSYIPFTKTSSSGKRFDEGPPNSAAASSQASLSAQQQENGAIGAKDGGESVFSKKTMKKRMLQEKKALGRVKLLKRKKPKEPSVAGVGEVITSVGSSSSHLVLSSSSTKLRIAPTKIISNTARPRCGAKFADKSDPKGEKGVGMICWSDEKDSVGIVAMKSQEATKTLKGEKASAEHCSTEIDSRDSISNQSSTNESQTGTSGRTKIKRKKGKSKMERASFESYGGASKTRQRNSGMSGRRDSERRGKASRSRPALSRANSDFTFTTEVEEKCACNDEVVNNTRVLCGNGEVEEAAGCRDEMARDLRDMAKELIKNGPAVLLDWLN